jgi:chromosome partitioning protein
MAVLTVATQKGGAGKTLICQVLASMLAADMRVVAIDADPTGALSRWASRAYEGAPFEAAAEADETRLAHLIAAKADSVDLVLVDTAGFGNRAATVAMTSADAVVVPSLVGEADITEAERTISLVAALARAARRDIPVRVLMNRIKRTTLARHASAEMTAAGLPRLNSSLSDPRCVRRAGRQPAPAVRDDRAAGHAIAASVGLRVCRMALRPRRHRLPC